MRKLLLFTSLIATGCAAQGEQRVGIDQVPPGARCIRSGALDTFVGQPASADLGARMMTAARARKLRWVPHGAVITMEYNPIRLTVRLDPQNRVASANCG